MNEPDSKLTEWALAELPSQECARLEKALDLTPERRSEADKHRAFCGEVEHALQVEDLRLSDARRAVVLRAFASAREKNARPKIAALRLRAWPAIAWAAAACLMLSVWWQVAPEPANPLPAGHEQAQRETTKRAPAQLETGDDPALAAANVQLAALLLRVANTERRLEELDATDSAPALEPPESPPENVPSALPATRSDGKPEASTKFSRTGPIAAAAQRPGISFLANITPSIP